MRKLLMATFCAALMTLGFSTTAGAQNDPGTIVDIAAADPNLSTLVTAVTEADLVDTLSGEGPFTVFAPTNAAFDALPAGTLDTLLADPSGDLTKILKLHVISGAVDSKAAIAAAVEPSTRSVARSALSSTGTSSSWAAQPSSPLTSRPRTASST